jgi:hypothetical protein
MLASCFRCLHHAFDACIMLSMLASCFRCSHHAFDACIMLSRLKTSAFEAEIYWRSKSLPLSKLRPTGVRLKTIPSNFILSIFKTYIPSLSLRFTGLISSFILSMLKLRFRSRELSRCKLPLSKIKLCFRSRDLLRYKPYAFELRPAGSRLKPQLSNIRPAGSKLKPCFLSLRFESCNLQDQSLSLTAFEAETCRIKA